VKQFARAERGNTAMIFALASISLLTAGGAGIDLSRAVVAKTRIAGALDAAALAVGTTSGPNTRFIARSCMNCHNEIHGSNSPAKQGRRLIR